MKFLILTVLAVGFSHAEGLQGKRGVAAEPQYAPASIAYAKLQQPVQKAVTVAAPQPQYYSQPAAYSLPAAQPQQQYQYQPQAVAYSGQAAAPAVAKVANYRPQFSLANDVSSFTYSSPVVTYNSLGLLTQVVGRGAAKGAPAPAPVAYQAPAQRVAYAPQPAPVSYAAPAPAPVQTRVALPQQAPQPQQYLAQAQQQAYFAPQAQAQAQTQAYSVPQSYSAPQTYSAQSVPQASYAPSPQYYSSAQALKQPGVPYGQ